MCSSSTHSELIAVLFILFRTGFVFKLLLEVITVVIAHTYYCVFKNYYNLSSAFKYVQYVFFLFFVLSKTTIFCRDDWKGNLKQRFVSDCVAI